MNFDKGNSTLARFEQIVERGYIGFESGRTKSLGFRKVQLESFLKLLTENYEDIRKAVMRDLNKSKWEVSIYDLDPTINVCKNLIRNLDKLAQPDKLPWNLLLFMDSAYISRIPYGVVLILGAWNLPIAVCLIPFLGAIAAGNAVVFKPSEIAHHTATVLSKLIPEYLDKECYQVVCADGHETGELLKLKFDLIYFVGSAENGRKVLKAAAEHLTPVTLELGGKSPCYVHESADLELSAKRIAWLKTVNLGQICVAPDYVLVPKKLEDDFVNATIFALRDFYGPPVSHQRNPCYGRIINEKHCLRLKRLLENTKGRIVYGGKVDLEDLWVEPTIVVDVPLDDPLMEGEIFGPILPIVTANYPERAIEIINSKPKPLALYVFSTNDSVTDKIYENCSSGTASVNDCGFQVMWDGLPFGGVGGSGMGCIGQGQIAFDTFSHKRSMLKRPMTKLHELFMEHKYPPYSDFKTNFSSWTYRNFGRFNVPLRSVGMHALSFCVGYILCSWLSEGYAEDVE